MCYSFTPLCIIWFTRKSHRNTLFPASMTISDISLLSFCTDRIMLGGKQYESWVKKRIQNNKWAIDLFINQSWRHTASTLDFMLRWPIADSLCDQTAQQEQKLTYIFAVCPSVAVSRLVYDIAGTKLTKSWSLKTYQYPWETELWDCEETTMVAKHGAVSGS